MPMVNGRRVSARTGNPAGRPPSEYPDFEKFLKMKKDGLLTVKEGCERLGISRSQWYALERKKERGNTPPARVCVTSQEQSHMEITSQV